MVAASTNSNFTLIAENHLIPHFGRMKIEKITEADVQDYIMELYERGRLDEKGGLFFDGEEETNRTTNL